MRRIFIASLFSLLFVAGYSANSRKLSGSSQISLITCTSGDELYSIFGHSALRVYDDSLHINEVYNYGTFDFNTPNFYLKFANGKLDYMLSAYDFKYFLPAYLRDKRGVSEQVLNLTQNEKQKLYEVLEWNRMPENKFYRYDFFFDNCATRIRDIVFNSLDAEKIYDNKDTLNMSFRDMLHLYLNKQPWTRDGIDLILGSRIDRKVTMYESTFLPDYLKDYFMHTDIKRGDEIRPLVISDRELLKYPKRTIKKQKITPELVTWLLFIILLILFIIEIRTKREFIIIDCLLLLITGLLGFVMFYLWFLTEHVATGANYNLMWAMPTNLVLMFFLRRAGEKGFFRSLGIITWSLLAFVVIGWKVIPQELPPMAFPLSLIMLIRLYKLLLRDKISGKFTQ